MKYKVKNYAAANAFSGAIAYTERGKGERLWQADLTGALLRCICLCAGGIRHA